MDILKALSRKSTTYDIETDDGVKTLHLHELSASQQLGWADNVKGRDMVDVYAELLKTCCDELAEYDVEDIKKISTSHLMAMGNKIIELSEAKKS